ncbi:MAG: TIR domain-containing protein [Bacteroidetes bacterium]|nr:MAG: TIR domain-containing protein [Bacteroidota bacterium]
MRHIFVSYSSKDRAKTKALAAIFEKNGWPTWWDKNITPGKAFDRAISKALDDAFCIVVLWSKNSVESSWVLDEAYEGLERKILVPVLIGTTRLPFGYRRLQYVDLTKWRGTASAAPMQRLLEQIAALAPESAAKAKPGKKAVQKKKPAAKPKRPRSLSGALDGKVIVFTGALSESRQIHAEKVKVVGANFVDSVSGKTDYLVVGKEPGATKLAAAEKLGVKQISEKKWLQMLNDAYQRTLLNKQIVFTGKLDAPRTELEALSRKLGAKPTGSISGKTDFLIVGENPGKVKLEAAKKYSVKIIKESLWKEIVDTL